MPGIAPTAKHADSNGYPTGRQALLLPGGGYPFPQQLHADFGTPHGLCSETASGSGVFEREFSKANIKMDCNTGIPSIEMKDGV